LSLKEETTQPWFSKYQTARISTKTIYD